MQNKTKLKFDQDFKACAMARKTLHFLICKGTKGEFVYYRITFKEKNCWIAMKMRVSSCIPLLQIDQRYVAEAGGGRPGHLRSVSNVIWILSSDTICQLNQLFLNSEMAMLSKQTQLEGEMVCCISTEASTHPSIPSHPSNPRIACPTAPGADTLRMWNGVLYSSKRPAEEKRRRANNKHSLVCELRAQTHWNLENRWMMNDQKRKPKIIFYFVGQL